MSVQLGRVNAYVYERIGIARFYLEDYHGARQALEYARKLQKAEMARGIGIPRYRRSNLLIYLGVTFWHLGQSSQAADCVCQGLEIRV